ncbi:MAG: hypothetical protein GY870_20850 [archaeon]|nr:hypothetical protein [archaeon]
MKKIIFIPKQPSGIFTILIFLLILLLAWSNRFILDDAFISFRYANNFINGSGLTWNSGEHIEGYTNFLWTILMAVPIFFGISPILFSQVLGILLIMGSFVFTYKLSDILHGSKWLALSTVIILGTNYTFSAFATGGLETQLQTFLFIAFTYLAFIITGEPIGNRIHFLILSILFSMAILTRLDSIIPISIIFVLVIVHLFFKQAVSLQEKIIQTVLMCLPTLLIVGSWLIWKINYYDAILPNTFHVKITSLTSLKRGLLYIYNFLESYKLLFLLPIITVSFFKSYHDKKILTSHKHIIVLLLINILWCIYLILIGGDFIEFRFFVPILPFVFILIIFCISSIRDSYIIIAILISIIFGSIYHRYNFIHSNEIESIGLLRTQIESENQNWDEIGKILKKLFSNQIPEVTIATTAAGAIPYYSGLRTIDMHGLNDKWIAKNGILMGSRPGHQRYATYDYLIQRGVNLVIGYPWVVPISTKPQSKNDLLKLVNIMIKDVKPDSILLNSSIIEIPINNKYKILILYLIKNDYIDKLLKKNLLISYQLSKS